MAVERRYREKIVRLVAVDELMIETDADFRLSAVREVCAGDRVARAAEVDRDVFGAAGDVALRIADLRRKRVDERREIDALAAGHDDVRRTKPHVGAEMRGRDRRSRERRFTLEIHKC